MNQKVLIIDDDERLLAMLRSYLQGRGFSVTTAQTFAAGRLRIMADHPDIVLLDGMLPDGDGIDLLRETRALNTQLPIIMLTARGDETDRIVGLEIGADDYVPKPFSTRELLARIQTVLRRSQGATETSAPPSNDVTCLSANNVTIDRTSHTVVFEGEQIMVSSLQFELLWLLIHSAGRVLTRSQIAESLYQNEHNSERAIDIQISRLRALLRDDPRHPSRIHSIRGVGYMFAT